MRPCGWPWVLSSTPMTSDSFMMRSSSPSILTSVPDHLPNSIRSPALRSMGMSLPASSRAPGPTATTSPSCGFSLAVSGMMMPPFVFSSPSMRRMTMRSCSGRNFMGFPLGIGMNARAERVGTREGRVPIPSVGSARARKQGGSFTSRARPYQINEALGPKSTPPEEPNPLHTETMILCHISGQSVRVSSVSNLPPESDKR